MYSLESFLFSVLEVISSAMEYNTPMSSMKMCHSTIYRIQYIQYNLLKNLASLHDDRILLTMDTNNENWESKSCILLSPISNHFVFSKYLK